MEPDKPEVDVIHRKYRRKPRKFQVSTSDLTTTVDDVTIIDDVTITTTDD